MSIDATLLDKVRMLPPEKQQEVADFIEFLRQRVGAPRRRARLKGFCSDLEVRITAGDIDEVRREALGDFPRGDV